MKAIRKLIVQNLALSYYTNLFGKTILHLRTVNILMPLFCVAGLYNGLSNGFDLWQALVFVPFFAVWAIWLFYLKNNPPKLSEMDWEQRFQYLKIHAKGISDRNKLERLEPVWKDKYEGKNFVEILRFASPLLWMVLTAVTYMIFN